jgi:hypothetical protein
LYDTELDYSDGTSMLGLEVDQGQLAVLEDDGFYTAYSFSTITGDLTPHQKYCHVVFSGANDCPTIPKWMCPYDAVGWGIAAKWAVIGLARGKSSPAADYVGGAVAASVAMFCNTYAMRGPWNARRLHLAVRFSRQRSS